MSRTVTLSREDLDAMQTVLDALWRAEDEIELLREKQLGKSDDLRAAMLFRARCNVERAGELVEQAFR